MIEHVLVDAGPLAALVNHRDQWHSWVQMQGKEIIPPLLTCESVISKACFLARRTEGGVEKILGLMERGAVQSAFVLKEQFGEVAALMWRYRDVPMSLADACLVRMAELHVQSKVLTLDSVFRRIYRRHKRQAIPLLMPEGR